MRTPNSDMNTGLKKGTWSHEEDQMLIAYISRYGIWNWSQMPRFAGLARSGKSCRLRWLNYLKPNIKRGNFSKEEDDIILCSHSVLGNKAFNGKLIHWNSGVKVRVVSNPSRMSVEKHDVDKDFNNGIYMGIHDGLLMEVMWSAIASKLPGRTDNEIKNHWHAHLKKRAVHYNMNPETPKQKSQNSSSKFEHDNIHEIKQPADVIDKLFESCLTSEDDIFSSSSTSTTTFRDQEVDFRYDYYDTGSPGTVDDLHSFWEHLLPFENLELEKSHLNMFSNEFY